tara:strand:- start:512 stop:640 length:129 start_codon:yes stop_codon:yes gene_type:complete
MAQSTRRRKKTVYVNNSASNEFFLFVAFHSAINAITNFFKDD